MSDDSTVRLGPDDRDGDADPRSKAVYGTIAGAVIAALVLAAFVVFGGDDEEEDAAEPVPSATTETTELTEATETSGPSTPGPTTAATPTLPEARQPSDPDVRAFISRYEAEHGGDNRALQADIDLDGVNELVFARVGDGVTVLDVAGWGGDEYAVVFSDEGGPAETVSDLYAPELTGSGGLEIVTEQRTGTEGRSVSVWGVGDDGYVRQEAVGGCAAGSHTYGVAGAEVEPGRIAATCPATADAPDVLTVDVYEWDGRQWSYTRTEEG